MGAETSTVSDNMPWKLGFSATLKEVRLERRLTPADAYYERSPGGSAMIYLGKRYVGEAFYDIVPLQNQGSSKWLVSFADRFAQLEIARGNHGLVVEPTQNDMEFRRIGSFELTGHFDLIDGDYSHISYQDKRALIAQEKRTWITLA